MTSETDLRMILGPSEGPVTPESIADLYPWPEDRRWLRAMMVTALDGGAVGADGRSGAISSVGDQLVFHAVRRFADVVLVGAQTIRAEGYHAIRTDQDEQRRRHALGLGPAPVLATVTASLDLPWHDDLFSGATLPPIVVTLDSADPPRLEQARAHADVVTVPGPVVEVGEVVSALESRGHRRIVCEGGPRLLAQLVDAGFVDEADITVSPRFVGTERTPRTPSLSPPVSFDLVHAILDGGFLINRYVRS